MATLRLPDLAHVHDTAAYLGRLMRYEPTAHVRLRGRGRVVGVFARPPFGVVALRALPLLEETSVDVTVAARDLAATVTGPRTTSHQEGCGVDVTLPTPAPDLAWTTALPPERGWTRVAEVEPQVLADAVRGGVGEFRARWDAPSTGRADAERVADEVWARPVLREVPLRAAHAAHALGFLRGDGAVVAYEHPAWHRLDGPYGTVAVRRHGNLTLHPRRR